MKTITTQTLDINQAISQIPQRPQTQEALNDQLRYLAAIANKMGLYDAADFVTDVLNRK